MGVDDLQNYLQSPDLEGGVVSVDLLKIARNVTQRQQPHNTNRKIRPIGNKLKLICDAENCLDRLYGGYFSDWACGGQWNRMIQFLSLLTRAIERGNIELAIVFNGTIEACRMDQWVAEQANVRQKVGMVLKHINTKATPPPKIWWTPPTCLRLALRMGLRHLGVTIMCTMDDHHQEVIAYCREYGFHGLLADDGEYAAFDPPRYFSSQNLKLTYKGSLETKEFMISELTKSLKLTQEQLCVMAALMGNFLLTENDLQTVHKRIGIDKNLIRENKSPMERNVKILADFVRTLPPPSNMEALLVAVFGLVGDDDPRIGKLRQSIQYYLNGTASGFLKYCAPPCTIQEQQNNCHNDDEKKKNSLQQPQENNNFDEISGFASETTEQEAETLHNYKLATVNLIMSGDFALENHHPIMVNSHHGQLNGVLNGQSNQTAIASSSTTSSSNRVNLLVSSSSSNASSVPTSPKNNTLSSSTTATTSTHLDIVSTNLVTPIVSPDVLRTASLRHQKGLMTSSILHVLSTQEVRLPCLMEDEANREFPPIHDIYQSLRQRVYAVLFNLHHLRYVHSKKKESGEILDTHPIPDIVVKEWIYSRSNPYQYAMEVKAEPLPWAVPTLQRLWFGPALDDKRRRMRALLSCLNSDTPLILNTGYVPQHMLIMACVLRYIMAQDRPIMRRNELDAFLCQAFNVDLMNPQYLQELTLNVVTSRGVQLAALFMQGVEMALLANDACGAPLPWLMCCPWLYFDGKLFHHTLNRSVHCKNILEVCENHIERVVKVERMRKAILEGLDVKFAKVPMAPFPGMIRPGLPAPGPQSLPPMTIPPSANRIPAGMRPRPVASRGGQLQVAGVVVGSWGANYGYQQNMRHHQQQQLVGGAGSGGYQGGRGRGLMGAGTSNFTHHQQPQNLSLARGRGGSGSVQQRKPGGPFQFNKDKKNNANKKRNSTNKSNKNQPTMPRDPQHTLTVKTETGDIPADEIIINSDETVNLSESIVNKPVEHYQHKGQGDTSVVNN